MSNELLRLTAYSKIIAKYRSYLAGTTPLNRWRNRLTGVFYDGAYAPSILGHFLGYKLSVHDEFITLIDRIAKFDQNADVVLEDLLDHLNTENILCDRLFAYFKDLENSIEDKNSAYYKLMPILKHDINHFAKKCGITKRIVKIMDESDDPTKHYEYEVVESDEARENQKDKDRLWKSRFNKLSKFIAFWNILPEIFIIATGYTLLSILTVYILGPLAIIGGSYLAYKFAQKDLYLLFKDIYLGRIFKKKSKKDGKYHYLHGYQIGLLILSSTLCVVAGLCNAALTYSCAAGIIGAASITVIASTAPAMSAGLALFVFCLWTAAFYIPIKQLITEISPEKWAQLKESFKSKPHESVSEHALRVTSNILKYSVAFAAAFTIMCVVGYSGYYVFKDKCAHMLAALGTWLANKTPIVWNALLSVLPVMNPVNAAEKISGAYSAIKLVFGIKKIMHITLDIMSAIFKKKIVTSEISTVAEKKINKIQEANKATVSTYLTSLAFFIPRSIATARIYADHSMPMLPSIPVLSNTKAIADSVGFYIWTIYSDAHNKEQKTPTLSTSDVRPPAKRM